ncbi:MAG: transglycosylase domain-containing protein [Clostridia bacterium]|nr:transglycosylase domain-containing protein [Clostridia bacterium]
MNKNIKSNSNSAKKKTAFSVFLGLLCVCVLTVCVVASYVLFSSISFVNGDIAIDLEEYKEKQNQTSFIYAYNEDGSLVEIARLHGEENRIWVDLDDISPYMKKAFVALEDTRFDEHHGVDWKRTIGVIVKPSNIGQGGSTITQQLIKNLTNQTETTTVRKFNEILTALNLEKNYTKDEIVEAYLNTLYLGSGCYGVETASEKYFGKDVSELNAAECAVIASITQKPTKNNPLLNPENNRERQLYCLKQMWKNGALTEEEYNNAVNYELVFTNSDKYVPDDDKNVVVEEEKVINSFYVDYVIQCVRDDLMEAHGYSKQQATDQIYYGGLKIYAAVDLEVQKVLEDVYVNRKSFPELYSEDEDIPVQSAMTIMDYHGRVVAIVGQAGEKTENRGLNRAANSFRQPGSTIKPIACYAPAIELNLCHFSTKIKDYAIAVNGKLWPHNVDETLGSNQMVTVQYALQESHNTVPARIINYDLGIDTSYSFLKDAFMLSRLDDKEDRQLAPLATGALYNGTTTVEMAAAYATFGNGGMYYKPFSYYKVTNSKGDEIILSNEEPAGHRAISEETSDIMCELLQTVNTSYYGTGSNVRRFPIMAKTGTTTNNTNRWFCAGTPYYVTAIWFGFDIPERLHVDVNPCGKIFITVFDRIHKDLPDMDFPKSTGTVKKTYCRSSGLLASSSCPSTGSGWYKINSLPGTCTSCSSFSIPDSSGDVVDQIIGGLVSGIIG